MKSKNRINQAVFQRKLTELCIRRKKYGRGFQYFDKSGHQIKDKSQLSYYKQLVIPPMWENVKICESRNGHI